MYSTNIGDYPNGSDPNTTLLPITALSFRLTQNAIFLPMEFLHHPAFWIVVAAASELIALSPLKSNSVVQLVFQVLNLLKAKKG